MIIGPGGTRDVRCQNLQVLPKSSMCFTPALFFNIFMPVDPAHQRLEPLQMQASQDMTS